MFAGGWGQNKGALPNRCDVRIPSLSSIHGCFLAGSPVSLSLRCDKRTRDAEPGSEGREVSESVVMSAGRVDRVTIALLFAYICLLTVNWSTLPFNVQWVDVLFPVLLLCTIAARPSFRLIRPDVLVLVYLASSLPSLFGAADLQLGIVPFAKHGYLALLYGVIAVLTAKLVDPARLTRWLAGLATGVAVVCVLAMGIYYVTGIAVPRLGAVMALPYVGQLYRPYGAFPSPEYLVSFLAFATPLVILQVLQSDDARHRRLWGTGVIVIFIVAVFTVGHGIVGLVAAATLSLGRAWRHHRPRLVTAVAIATVALFIMVNILLVVAVRDLRVVTSRDMSIEPPAYRGLFQEEEAGAPKISVELTYGFMGYWLLKQLAWDAFLQKPWQGIGLGSFLNETRQAASEGRIPSVYREYDPHSTWFGRMAETGIIGTVALAMLWIGMLRFAYRLVAAGGRQADVAAALAAGLVAILVISPNVDVMNFRFIWIAFGVLHGASNRA